MSLLNDPQFIILLLEIGAPRAPHRRCQGEGGEEEGFSAEVGIMGV